MPNSEGATKQRDRHYKIALDQSKKNFKNLE